jgi:hypothetical protein
VIEEARRIAEAAQERKLRLKLMGGGGVHLHSQSATRPPLRRKYGDLDFVTSKRDRPAVEKLFPALGYEANDRFNLLQGDTRLAFLDNVNGRQIDIFVERIRMSHVIDLKDRLDFQGPSLTPADLLVSKLQVFEVNMKDLVDSIALLHDHPVADHDDEAINARYIARLCSQDWGLYRTLQINMEKVRKAAFEMEGVQAERVDQGLEALSKEIESQPKSMKWKLRAQVGDRVRWYELPEEVRQPYQAE